MGLFKKDLEGLLPGLTLNLSYFLKRRGVSKLSIHKKIVTVSLMLLLIFQGSISAASAIRPIAVNINGGFIATDSNPFIVGGRVMVPIRTLASLGLSYSWDSKSHTATITNSTKDTFKMTQGLSIAYKNGQPVKMDSEANNYNGRMMVPARFVSEAFGYSVYYEGTRGILFVTSKDYAVDSTKLTSSNIQEARIAAISLPIQYSFKSDRQAESDKNLNYTYIFAANDATRYIYENGSVSTVVEIKNNKANAVWQYSTGGIPGNDLYTTLGGKQPSYIAELHDDYFDNSGGKYKAYYTASDGSTKSFTYQPKNYGEIIQPIPLQ
ncbi:copper amine oxidase N-terminal domain-containing protein [Paenibacillus tritici]|uniref:copper amine oxidase N-terminal domain-containing protein n=1 Tax=Paenibacillus tritici TaxID=1873425 RepID=UPI001BAC048F|nr:copper amine oxidase N-terminal domain-containing protein [Paenibacillus tritici]QUL54622.1 copper amine oxidase N-terminal domain-containing protein [Paenibacillus tritici]